MRNSHGTSHWKSSCLSWFDIKYHFCSRIERLSIFIHSRNYDVMHTTRDGIFYINDDLIAFIFFDRNISRESRRGIFKVYNLRFVCICSRRCICTCRCWIGSNSCRWCFRYTSSHHSTTTSPSCRSRGILLRLIICISCIIACRCFT